MENTANYIEKVKRLFKPNAIIQVKTDGVININILIIKIDLMLEDSEHLI